MFARVWSIGVGFGISKVWFKKKSKKVQKTAARSATSSYCFETGSIAGILEKLRWESLKKRRRYSRLILLYKGLKGMASIPTEYLIPPIRRSRNHHSLTIQISTAKTDIYKGSFFPQTFRDWNTLPDLIISSAEGAEMVWLGLPLLWKLGTNFLYHRS